MNKILAVNKQTGMNHNHLNEEKVTLAIVNHELRNPLAVIKLHAQLLEMTIKNNKNFSPSAVAAVIVRSIDEITNVLDQYLSGRNDISTCEDEFTEFDLSQLIDETLLNFKALYPGYTFIRQNSTKCRVKADRFQIGQVLINYLHNAVKFSPANSRIGIVINITFSGIEVGITDDGIGVPDGQEKRIFDRFYQIGKRPDSDDGSRGLGLFLVKEIIQRHHGSVWVQKSRSGGSIFFFSLPGNL